MVNKQYQRGLAGFIRKRTATQSDTSIYIHHKFVVNSRNAYIVYIIVYITCKRMNAMKMTGKNKGRESKGRSEGQREREAGRMWWGTLKI